MTTREFASRHRAALLRHLAAALVVPALLMLASAAAAQAQALHAPSWVSTALPPDHWAVEAARRAEALGLVSDYLPAQRMVPRAAVEAALAEAAERAVGEAPHLVGLTSAWQERYLQEFGGVAGLVLPSPWFTEGNAAHAGYVDHSGGAAAGTGIFPENKTGAAPRPAVSEVRAGATLTAGVQPFAAGLLQPALNGSDPELAGWDVALGHVPLALSLGRQPVGYGYARSGIVLSGTAPLDRLQLETTRPVRLPGPFRYLGNLALHAFGSRLREPRHPGDPYLWGIAGSVQPHPRITLSVHRASIVGGDSVNVPLTPRNFFRTFIGHNLLNFENEVVSAHLRLRLPTEPVMPLTVYGEWGAEDAAGAWRDVPGRLVGVFVPALPALPAAALGVEYAAFAPSCCGNPPWYRHSQHTGGWAEADRPLGHELGGQGRQLTGYALLDLWRAGLRFEGEGFLRRREGENLYVPGREGSSRGGALRASWRVLPRGELSVAGTYESGSGWRERAVAIGARTFF